jgi:hypothetical protein
MTKSINDNQKKRGRPATGTAPLVGVRMTPLQQDAIKGWAADQGDTPSLAEAIRRLVEIGLAGATTGRAKKSASSPKSSDLAAMQIDKLVDKTLPAEEQAVRKRRLLKGPSEFRDVRVDVPKAKKK